MSRVPTKEAFQKKIGARVAMLRKHAGLTLEELAARCDKERQSIYRLEKGRINPSAYYLAEIAAALEVPVKALLDFE